MTKTSVVYFIKHDDVAQHTNGVKALEKLWKSSGMDAVVPKKGFTALKLHFGEEGNKRTVPPEYVKKIGELTAHAGGKPFATDTTTLYSGKRQNAVEHLALAAEHGYSYQNLGMPVIIADGLRGQDQVAVPIKGKHFKQASLASAWAEISGYILITHITGHVELGMGGALKNAAMGWASRGGKLMQHSATKPKIDNEKCVRCGICVKRCPVNALSIAEGFPELDSEVCIGCGQCFSVCPEEAVYHDWDGAGPLLHERIAEYATAAAMPKQPHVGAITFLTRITKQCDCMGNDHKYRLPDIGLIASTDLVAIDTAAKDLCDKAFGGDFFKNLWPDNDCSLQLEHAERMGLGNRKYKLVEI